MGFSVVAAVSQKSLGLGSLAMAVISKPRKRLDQRHQLRGVVRVGTGQPDRQRDASAIGGQVVLGAALSAVGGIGASQGPPKTARTELLSMAARFQSI